MAAPRPPAMPDRPHLERVLRIAHDHILFAQRNPAHLANIAERLRISPDAALAFAIADEITEGFSLTEREA